MFVLCFRPLIVVCCCLLFGAFLVCGGWLLVGWFVGWLLFVVWCSLFLACCCCSFVVVCCLFCVVCRVLFLVCLFVVCDSCLLVFDVVGRVLRRYLFVVCWCLLLCVVVRSVVCVVC